MNAAGVDSGGRVPERARVRAWLAGGLLAVAAVLVPGSGERLLAQTNVDSLVGLFDSPDWHVRANAVFALYMDHSVHLASSYAPRFTALLEREAVGAIAAAPSDENGYGEYEIHLVELTLRFEDPASLRGMALLGIQTSRAAKEFVAQQGAASLPYLDEAWRRDRHSRMSVITTWALLLGKYMGILTREQRLDVKQRLFQAADSESLGFAWAAETAPLPEAVPLVELIAATTQFDIVRRRAQQVSTSLRPRRDGLPPGALLERLTDWLDAICRGAEGARHGACESLGNLLADARTQVAAGRLPAAKNVVSTFADRADTAFHEGALSDAEHRLFAENARYLVERL